MLVWRCGIGCRIGLGASITRVFSFRSIVTFLRRLSWLKLNIFINPWRTIKLASLRSMTFWPMPISSWIFPNKCSPRTRRRRIVRRRQVGSWWGLWNIVGITISDLSKRCRQTLEKRPMHWSTKTLLQMQKRIFKRIWRRWKIRDIVGLTTRWTVWMIWRRRRSKFRRRELLFSFWVICLKLNLRRYWGAEVILVMKRRIMWLRKCLRSHLLWR